MKIKEFYLKRREMVTKYLTCKLKKKKEKKSLFNYTIKKKIPVRHPYVLPMYSRNNPILFSSNFS